MSSSVAGGTFKADCTPFLSFADLRKNIDGPGRGQWRRDRAMPSGRCLGQGKVKGAFWLDPSLGRWMHAGPGGGWTIVGVALISRLLVVGVSCSATPPETRREPRNVGIAQSRR